MGATTKLKAVVPSKSKYSFRCTKPTEEARLRRTKENSPTCAREIPTVKLVLRLKPNALTTNVINVHLNTITISSVANKTSKCTQRKNGFIIIPIEVKNRAAKKLRTGSIFCSIFSENGVDETSKPAINAPSSKLKPRWSLSQEIARQ